MCWRPLTPPLRGAAVYLVRSFRTNARIRSLTTGTFNRVVKDRIAFRLSGAPSVLDGLTTRVNPAVLETLQTYVAAQTLSTRASHRISTRFPHWEDARDAAQESSTQHWNQEALSFRVGESPRGTCFSKPPRNSTARNGMAFRFGSAKHADDSAHGLSAIAKRKTEN